MGQQESYLRKGGDAGDFELVSNGDIVQEEIVVIHRHRQAGSRPKSIVVDTLCENHRLETDLAHSLHQHAKLGNAVAIERKLQRKRPDVNKLDGDQLAPLHYAARHNHISAVKVLLQNNAQVNILGQDDRTPLHYAARCRNTTRPYSSSSQAEGTLKKEPPQSMIILLTNNGAEVNGRDKYGQTPLHYAAMTGNLHAAKDLVEHCQADVEIKDTHEMTPLIVAATHGHYDMVKLFLDQDATNIRQADASKQTALHRSAKGGHLEVVKLLLAKGSSLKQFKGFLDGTDSKYKTPLFHAASNGHTEVARLLVSKGANVIMISVTLATPLHAAAGVGSVNIIKLLVEQNVDLDVRDIYERTPLMYAVAGNHRDAISLLCEMGASIDHRDMNYCTPLLIAAQNGHAEVLKILLHMRANPKAVDKLDQSAIYHCAEQGKIEPLKVLLKYKPSLAMIDAVDSYGHPPLHTAILKGNKDVMKLLLKHGASFDIKSDEQDNVLHLAAKKGCASLIQELLPKSSALLNAENENLDTPLHLACKWGKEDVVRLLLEAGADVSATNSSSSTPLHMAAVMGYIKCCELLLDFDAPLDRFDKDFKTPLMLAVLENHVDVTRLFLDKGVSLAGFSCDHMNALEMAVEAGKSDIALAIVQSPGWESGMRSAKDDTTGNRLTPFRRMIEKMPNVAEEVLNRCIKTCPQMNDLDAAKQSISFEYLDDTYESTLNGVSQFDDEGVLKKDAEPYTSDSRLVKCNHPLTLMIKYKRPELLSHPVCVTLIKHKWTKYVRRVYSINFALYLIFLISLTTYVITARIDNWKINDKNITSCDGRTFPTYAESHLAKLLLVGCKWTVISMVVLHIIKEISQFYQARTSYLSVENLIEWICYPSALLFVWDFKDCSLRMGWQWQLGATSIFLSWINLLLFVRVFPFFGIYVIMFTVVLTTFSSFFPLFFLFIVAFALGFYTVLGEGNGFKNPAFSVLRTAVTMMGEINFENIFVEKKNPLKYPAVSYILLIAFFICMSILIMNLLVGLAVDDIKVVQEHALLQKLALQTKLVLDLEMVIPSFMRRKHILREMKVVSRRNSGVLGYLSNKFIAYKGKEVSEVEDLRREIQLMKQSLNSLMEVTLSLNELAVLKASSQACDKIQVVEQKPSKKLSIQQGTTSDSGVWQEHIDF